MMLTTVGGDLACADSMNGTCILHFTSSIGVRTIDVQVPDTAPQKMRPAKGISPSVKTVALRTSFAIRYYIALALPLTYSVPLTEKNKLLVSAAAPSSGTLNPR